MCEPLFLRVGKKKQRFWVLSVGKVWCHQAGDEGNGISCSTPPGDSHQEKAFYPDEFHLQLKKKSFYIGICQQGQK